MKNIFGKPTKRQMLEDAIANSQKVQEYGMNTQNFGGGYAGGLGLLAQGLTAGVGAYQEYKQKQELAKLDAENNEKFVSFANAYGDKDLGSLAPNLSDETKQAYILSKIAPNLLNKVSNNQTPAAVQEWEAFKKLPQNEQKQYMNLKRNIVGEGAILNESGNVETLPGYGQAGAQKKGMEQNAKNSSDLNFQPKIEGEKVFEKERAETIAKDQANFNKKITQYDYMIDTLEKTLNHEGLPDIVGAKGGGNILFYTGKKEPIAGTKAASAKASYEQLKGQQFLQSFESIKGGGAVSNEEGKAATDAYSALKLDSTEEDFKKEGSALLQRLKDLKQKEIEKNQQGYQPTTFQQTFMSQQGTLPKLSLAPKKAPMQKSTIIKRYNPQTGRIE